MQTNSQIMRKLTNTSTLELICCVCLACSACTTRMWKCWSGTTLQTCRFNNSTTNTCRFNNATMDCRITIFDELDQSKAEARSDPRQAGHYFALVCAWFYIASHTDSFSFWRPGRSWFGRFAWFCFVVLCSYLRIMPCSFSSELTCCVCLACLVCLAWFDLAWTALARLAGFVS